MFYLLSVLRRRTAHAGLVQRLVPEPNLAHFLDLVALGTVADLVPLDHNNRVLVRQGLERIRRGMARPGLMALLRWVSVITAIPALLTWGLLSARDSTRPAVWKIWAPAYAAC